MKRPIFVNGEFYHIYNRGVDKRNIFSDQIDLARFFESMTEFNSVKPIGSIYENSFLGFDIREKRKSKKLVEIICYCLNPNHYHFILRQISDSGISEFMKRLGGGYTWYFNNRYKRGGALFQGLFKVKHIDANKYLLHLSAYVNLNNRVHKLGGETAKLSKSSWKEYIGGTEDIYCEKRLILNQFKNKTEYKSFCEDSLESILEQKRKQKEMADILLEE